MLYRQRDGRSAISLQHIINKRKRYDPKVAKQKQFYAQSKQYKAYQRLLKREGYTNTTQPTQLTGAARDDDDNHQPQQSQQKKRKREEERQDDDRSEEKQHRREAQVDEEGRISEETNRDEVEDGEEPQLEWAGRKKKKKKAAPVVKTREEVQREIEERRRMIADSRHVRAEKFKRHAQRTSRGQPVSRKLPTCSLSASTAATFGSMS